MHGEYKVPGGKLVVVDLDVVDGVIANFQLAGDFFLEPDSALEAINRAVNGLPEESESAQIAAAVKDALPVGALLLGFSPRGSPWRSAGPCPGPPAGPTTTGSWSTVRPTRQRCRWRWIRSDRGSGSRPPPPNPADLGAVRAGGHHRQLPVGEERSRPGRSAEVRLRGGAANHRRRGDLRRTGFGDHLFDLCAH